jgi:glycosyltransferase involved in cell wall biosynthesis
MRVLIVEPDLTGHHAPYLRHMLSAIAELGQEAVVLTCHDAAQSPQFALHLQDVSAGATWDECLAPFDRSPRYTHRLFAELLQAIKRHHADHVWVPYADFMSLYLGARASIGWKGRWPAEVQAEGLNFRSTFAYPAPHWRKLLSQTLTRLFVHKANWDILHFLDPIPYDLICRRYPHQSARFRAMPDPVEGVPRVRPGVAREKLGIPSAGRYAGYLGLMTDRGNVDRLLSAFRRARLSQDDRLLLAGPMSDSVRSCVDKDYGDLLRSGRVVKVERHLNLAEVMLGVMACDLVCIPAKFRMGSSSFLIRAATAGRPVLADNFGWTGWAIERFELGWNVDVSDVPAFASMLEVAMENAGGRTPSPAAERFVRFHSADNFKGHWTARLRERLELPPDPNFVPWHWVLDESLALKA